jgi:asparagine synthase (glutamine-hydrolysing)
MCGIFGIVNIDGNAPAESLLRKHNDLAAHRGPDGNGIYSRGTVGLAHRRLAIIDLSSDATQPMVYRDRFAITYNGEVYNYLEIRQELVQRGHVFKSRSDTEVVVAAYSEWGEECFCRFNGMWALAIHDQLEDTVLISRDRFGKKPLHWIRTANCIAFASEIRQLLPLLPRVLANSEVLDAYLSHGLEGDIDTTFFAGVNRLPGGHILKLSARTGAQSSRRWYTIAVDPSIDGLNDSEAHDAIRSCLTNAVALRLRSDVRVGTCLSGGLDSSSIASIAAPLYREINDRKLTAIHSQSSEPRTDELSYAKRVSDYGGMELVVVSPQVSTFRELLDEVVWTQEEPFGSPSILMQYCVMQKARELGCTVMLDGQGGDETMFGNERCFVPQLASLLRAGRVLGMARAACAARTFHLKRSRAVLKAALFAFPTVLGPLESFVRKRTRPGRSVERPPAWASTMNTTDHREVQIADIVSNCLPRLLRYEDRNSMRHGIETRLPFLDWRFVELGVSLHARMKIRDGYLKHALRKAMVPLVPTDVMWRTNKCGFEAPEMTWMSACRRDMDEVIGQSRLLDGLFRPRQLNALDHGSYWRLFNVAAWERAFGVTDAVAIH